MSLVLCSFAALLLSLSAINDTGKVFDEAAKTFKMFEKSDASESSSKDNGKKGEKSESSELISKEETKRDKIDSDPGSDTTSSDGVSEPAKKSTISEKIENIGKGYKKIVLNPLRVPSQCQKLLYATAKPISEFLGAGYLIRGCKLRGAEPIKWSDYFGGKFDDGFLGLT